MKEQQKITKEILEKYNIYEDDYEMYRMKGIKNESFLITPRRDGKWNYLHVTSDNAIHATNIIETEDELVTCLQFSKLYREEPKQNEGHNGSLTISIGDTEESVKTDTATLTQGLCKYRFVEHLGTLKIIKEEGGNIAIFPSSNNAISLL